LWESAARAATTSGDWATVIEHAGRARNYHLQRDQDRAAARAQAAAGAALRLWGHLAEARDQLTPAVEVLRAQPDTDTVHALADLARVEVFAGSPAADRLTTEALDLGQAVGVGATELARLLDTRGIYLAITQRLPQAAAYCREAARLATQAGDSKASGLALVNLAGTLEVTDPTSTAEAARTAAGYARQVGDRETLAYAVGNLVQALLMLGDWDGAEQELAQAVDGDGLAGIDELTYHRAWLAALRGDAATAASLLAELGDIRDSEDSQDISMISMVEAFTATARRQPHGALRCARETLAHAHALGISFLTLRWAWPLGARAAHELGDTAATSELLALLDSYQPGHLAPMQRAERDLARARLTASDGDPAAATAFAAAISSLRELNTPYHLAHGLLDHACYLTRLGDTRAAAAAIGEARDIAGNLRCQPLLDQAGNFTPAKSAVQG
jgi:hypothetical protein